jgi:hypothetical protein
MATAEKRTLSIEARLKDHLTAPLGVIERTLKGFAAGGLAGLKRLVSGFFSLKSAVVGLVAAYGGLRAIGAIREFGEQADALLKLAGTTGDTIANLSELQAAFELAGVKGDQFDDVLRTLQNSQRDAADGSEKQRDAFAELGISLEQVRDLAPSQLFEQIARGLGGLNSEFDRQVALSKLLPKQFQALMPVLGGGLREFQQAIVEAREAGATVTEEQARVAEQFNDAITKVTLSLGSVSRALLVAFGPRATALLESIAKGIASNKDRIVEIAEAIGVVVVRAINLAIDGVINLVGVIESIPGVNLLGTDFNRQIADLERAALTYRTFIAQGVDFTGDMRKKLDGVQQQLVDLQEKQSRGLAGALRATKAGLQQQLDDLTNQIRNTAAGAGDKSPDETAAALGLPTSNDIGVWEREAKKQIQAAVAASGAASAVAGSVFQTPARPAPAPQRDTSGNQRERFALLQQIGNLAGDLQPVQDALAEIEAQATVLALAEAKEKGVINAQECAAAVALVKQRLDEAKAASNGFFGGFAAGARAALQRWTDFAAAGREAAATLVDGGLNGLTDAFADIITGTKSAKEAFKDFARQMLADLARMIAKLFIMRTLQAAFGMEDGGVVPAMEKGGIRAFAAGGVNRNGGIARRPTVLFGEGKTAEAFVPLPDNRSIPVSFVGGGPSGGNVVNFVIHAMDSRDVQRALYEQQGTLRTIFTNQAETQHGMRQVIRRAAG